MEEWPGYYGTNTWGGLEYFGIKHQMQQPVLISEIKGGTFVGIGIMKTPVP